MKHPSDPLAFLDDELEHLARHALLREPATRPSPELSFCSNDYLGRAREPAPSVPAGAGASRLIAGQHTEHEKLEHAFARWLGYPSALAFSSGYAANVGVLSALVRPEDHVISDALNHASIIDGIRLARTNVSVIPHLDLTALSEVLRTSTSERKWVVLESYYSMDADGPDLRDVRALCDAHHAVLIVDEAHALGVLGPEGRGRCAEADVRPDILVGTLGKAFGSQGAFVAARPSVRAFLWNRARSFVFSTGLSPMAAAAARRSLGWLKENPEVVARIARLSEDLRAGLRSVLDLPILGFGHIIPIVLGASEPTLAFAQALRERQIDVHAIRPPTVPEGTCRIRMTVTARHTKDDVDRAVHAIAAVWTELRGG